MKNIVIVDKNYRFRYENIIVFIIISALLVSSMAMIAYVNETTAYSKNQPVLEVLVGSAAIALLFIFISFTLQRYVYIDLTRGELRMYLRILSIEITYLIAPIRDIVQWGVSSYRYYYDAHQGPNQGRSKNISILGFKLVVPSSSKSNKDNYKNYYDKYYAVVLRNDGKVFKITGETTELAPLNEWVNKTAKKLKNHALLGKQDTTIEAIYNNATSKYEFIYSAGFKNSVRQTNPMNIAAVIILMGVIVIPLIFIVEH